MAIGAELLDLGLSLQIDCESKEGAELLMGFIFSVSDPESLLFCMLCTLNAFTIFGLDCSEIKPISSLEHARINSQSNFQVFYVPSF